MVPIDTIVDTKEGEVDNYAVNMLVYKNMAERVGFEPA
jgi:hypothetical protein